MRVKHIRCRSMVTLGLTIVALAATGASAQPLRELCPTRPGLGTAPCIVDNGHAIVELGLIDWTVESSSDSRADTVLAGDLLVRYGLTDLIEIQIGWTAFGHARERDKVSGSIAAKSGIGDLTFALKHSLRNPGGNGFSIALQPFVTLPLGGTAIGSGDWGAGLLVPISYDLNDDFQLQLTPEIGASVDSDRRGRHFSGGAVIGLGFSLSDHVGATLEVSGFRDRDPADATTELLAGLSLAWQPTASMQLDVGTAFGLNRNSPDAQLAVGFSGRF